MTTRVPRFRFSVVFASLAFSGGCQAVWEDLAREPYDHALRQGRMSPTEYMRVSEQIEQAANPPAPAGRIPDKYK